VSIASRFVTSLLLAFVLLGIPLLNAGWLQEDIAVSVDPANQQAPMIAPDGQGGAIVTWENIPDVCYDVSCGNGIVVQRFSADGTPLWPAAGVSITDPPNSGQGPLVMPDGSGGAYVFYRADSSFCTSIYCQGDPLYLEHLNRLMLCRISSGGALLWKKQVRPISPQSYTEFVTERYPRMLPDGSGGILITWELAQGYTPPGGCGEPPAPCHGTWNRYHIYAQRIDADGNRLWGSSGVRVSLDEIESGVYTVAPAASGSIIVAWTDIRNNQSDIYAQKIDASGTRAWGDVGAPVILHPANQTAPSVASDGSGGGFIVWKDDRDAVNPSNIHLLAQRIDSSGAALWDLAGVPVSTAFGEKFETGIVPRASGSAIVYWVDGEDPYGHTLYAQRLDSTGATQWQTNGRQLSDASGTPSGVRAVPDGEGGAVLAWEQNPTLPYYNAIRSIWGFSSTNIYAVGEAGAIFHYDGQSWQAVAVSPGYDLHDIWGSSPDDVYAVGVNGTVLHYDGSSWQYLSVVPTTKTLWGVWGSGASDVFVVGSGGTIRHWDGSSWQTMDYPVSGTLTAVHGNSGSNIYAVGKDDGYLNGKLLILKYDGSTWSKVVNGRESPGAQDVYYGVWVSPEGQVFISGEYITAFGGFGIILQYDGITWRTTRLRQSASGFGIWGSDSSNVYVSYANTYGPGYLWHYDGRAWLESRISTDRSILDVWGTGGSNAWTGGTSYSIRHFEDGEWVTQFERSGSIFASRIDSAGNALWSEYGAPVSPRLDAQSTPSLSLDGAGNALVAWRDSRHSSWDIYAKKVSISRGPLVATELVGFSVDPGPKALRISWRLSSFANGARFEVSRKQEFPSNEWVTISPEISRKDLAFDFTDAEVEGGMAYRYRVRISDGQGDRVLFETDAVQASPMPLALKQNYPNPFNPSTTIRYDVPRKCRVLLEVYDVSGRRVARLVDGVQDAGHHGIEWHGTNAYGRGVASGIYFYRLTAGKETISRKMVLMK
jgi:hypothetical protein